MKTLNPPQFELNKFEKYIKEMFWRAKWASTNIERLKEYIGDAWGFLRIDLTQPVTIIPLVVSNNIIDIEKDGYPSVITSNELSNLLFYENLCQTEK